MDSADDQSPGETIEERCFSAALIILEGHFTQSPPMGPLTGARVNSLVSKTLEKTHTLRPAREALSRNVGIWIWLTRIFAAAIPSLTARSVGPLSSLNDPDKGVSPRESTALIVVNHGTIKEDLGSLIKLMHIARNMLVNAEPQVPQDLCAAVHFDQMVYQTIILCVNVTSKGYDGEILDDTQRQKLTEVTELYKKLLVTSLQQAHNWTAKHDRNKTSFWFDILFDDEDGSLSAPEEGPEQGWRFKPDVAKQQVQHWLDRNSRMCDTARKLLRDYTKNSSHKPPGPLAPIRPLAWNWLPEASVKVPGPASDTTGREKISPIWKPDEPDLCQHDRSYGRVSREIDTWWLRARDPNYEDWVVDMPSVEFAQTRLQHCKSNMLNRYAHPYGNMQSPPPGEADDATLEHCHCRQCHSCPHAGNHDEESVDEGEGTGASCPHAHADIDQHGHDDHGHDESDYANQYVEDILDDDEEVDDDVSYGDGPLTGLLTEVPNILDPKQIEALHMIIKSCILDNAGTGVSNTGENIQSTRCRMLLALDCGKSLLRELFVFIAVWDKDEQSLIFQVTTQIVEALHHNALIPYAWNTLRIPKDVISPAQTVLLRLVNHMLRSQNHTSTSADALDGTRSIKLVHFLFSFFRSRVVPDCAALIHLQALIREKSCTPADFPVDSWDMERAKDGLSQYLDFLTAAAEPVETRQKLIEWNAVYDLITILSGLEAGIPKKPLAELPKRASRCKATASSTTADKASSNHMVERPYSTTDQDAPSSPPPPPPPPLQEPAHKFPWSGVKAQIFTILATLLQPPPGQSSPGNSAVQTQIVKYNGIVPLLNSCAYDDHNPYAKERVAVCLKWLLDGCDAANRYIRELVSMTPHSSNLRPGPGGTPASAMVRVDGVPGEVKVQVRRPWAGTAAGSGSNSSVGNGLSGQDGRIEGLERTAKLTLKTAPAGTKAEDDFMA
ncbi:hypothetical protein CDD82_6566 [Ophiocordyceps australis]|uniref:Ataxin-10 homolog n=1 Tax=Ophiocordyceps australis TaxID=1399860 RepID=A0A2C5ZMF2_9HYPO|nr:hypothetical protein CDD82_6566 [Ophiocordyceps australis]